MQIYCDAILTHVTLLNCVYIFRVMLCTTILANIVACLQSVDCIDKIVLGIAEGIENKIFIDYAKKEKLFFIVGDESRKSIAIPPAATFAEFLLIVTFVNIGLEAVINIPPPTEPE